MNDEEKVDVTVQWYKANVIRLVFNGRVIWETKDIALDDIARDNLDLGRSDKFKETTLRLGSLEAMNYSKILLQGLQVGRLEQINLLVQLRVEQWQMKVILFERQLKQRMVDLRLAELLKDIDPDNPGGYTLDDGEPVDEGEDDAVNGYYACEDCDGGCDGDGAHCEKIDIDDIESDDDTLRLCKDCPCDRNSCAGCEYADPDDRFMNYGDVDMQKNNEQARSNGKRAGGAGLADNDGIYQR